MLNTGLFIFDDACEWRCIRLNESLLLLFKYYFQVIFKDILAGSDKRERERAHLGHSPVHADLYDV